MGSDKNEIYIFLFIQPAAGFVQQQVTCCYTKPRIHWLLKICIYIQVRSENSKFILVGIS